MPAGLERTLSSTLKRELSLVDVFIVTTGSMISSGLFIIPAYRPVFHAPLYPWLQLFSIIGLLILLVKIDVTSLLISLPPSGRLSHGTASIHTTAPSKLTIDPLNKYCKKPPNPFQGWGPSSQDICNLRG